MTDQELLATAGDFAISVLLGALIGIEREKRKSEEDDTGHVAGLRTFTLLALLGAVAGWRDLGALDPGCGHPDCRGPGYRRLLHQCQAGT